MTSITHRIAALFRIKANKALDRAEDPREVLDYSYEQQLQMLQGMQLARGHLQLVHLQFDALAAGGPA